MPLRFRPIATATALLLAAALTGCSEGSSEPSEAPADVGHIHGLGTNPADGKLYVATHQGIIVVNEDGTSKRVSDNADYMGFTVAKADTFLGSGHPAPGGDGPPNRGLIESTDAGKTWKTRSLGGEVDFHALEYAHGMIYGYDSTNGMLRVSKGGTTWDERAQLAAVDIAVSPKDPDTVLATTEDGIAKSTDGGKTFTTGASPVMVFISWAEDDALYGISTTGALSRSADGGETWEAAGSVPGGQPQALTALDDKHLLAASQGGVYESRDGGETFTERLSTSED
ncbi:MAG TPA: hypothetical protein DEQ61_21860 [Streptomyces sp.]|nr:hypothetical protein [Streptomyces sp.]